MSRKIAIVCLWLLCCGSVFGEEPCEAPTASDYSNASQEPIDSPQGFVENFINWSRMSAKAKIEKYEQCLKQQEANLRRERLKAEAEVLRAETEAIKAETEALKNDARKPSTRNLYGDADYQIDLGLVLDFEDTRKLIEQCAHLGRLEVIRGPLESATDLEYLRATLESHGIVEFYGCPSGVGGSGIKELSRIDFVPQTELLKEPGVSGRSYSGTGPTEPFDSDEANTEPEFPIDIRIKHRHAWGGYKDATLVFREDSIEFRELKDQSHNFKMPTSGVIKINSSYKSLMGNPSYTLHFSEKTKAGDKISFEIDPPSLETLEWYLRNYCRNVVFLQ